MKNRPVSLFFRQFYITAKRFVMKPSLWILVILVGGFCMFIHTTEENEDPTSIIGYHIEDMGKRHDESDIIRDAIDEYEGYFTFEEFEDIDELENQVATTKISCGYVIPSDIYTKILDGDDDGIITTFVNADTTLEFLTNEIFFSLLFNEITSRELAVNIMSEAGSADALPAEFSHHLKRGNHEKSWDHHGKRQRSAGSAEGCRHLVCASYSL